jgi:luciferase family oxidoreductase group 1
MISARALSVDGKPRFNEFPQQVELLQRMLGDENYRPAVNPKPESPAAVWMLGSSTESAALAGERGLPYNFALFINPQMDARILEYYRHQFQPSAECQTPYCSLTVNVTCAESEEQAQILARCRQISFLRFASGKGDSRICTPEEAASVVLSEDEEAFIQQRSALAAIGTPAQVRDKLFDLADQYGADELMTVTITYDFAARKRSYELLAEAFALSDSQ